MTDFGDLSCCCQTVWVGLVMRRLKSAESEGGMTGSRIPEHVTRATPGGLKGSIEVRYVALDRDEATSWGAWSLARLIGQERASGGTCIFNNSLSVKRPLQVGCLPQTSSTPSTEPATSFGRFLTSSDSSATTDYPSNYFQPAKMADASGDAKPTPSADQTASSDLRVAGDETKLVTNPIGDETKEAPASDTQTSTVTETASTAATNVATSASAAAAGVKDSVFSMFGGGAKKEKKEDEDDAKDEPSGSSKVKKEDEDEVKSTVTTTTQ